MRKNLRISGLLSALLMAWGVHAAGLGKLTVQSALGEPLRAQIELLSVPKGDLGNITAKLANSDAYRQAHIEWADALSGLHFKVMQSPSGQAVIRISSTKPVNDPFLDMLIEIDWNSGRLLREYTILLDPPGISRSLPEATPTQSAMPAATMPVPGKAASATAEVQPKPAAPVAKTAKRYGPVKAGETLMGIAVKTRPEDVTVDQMMLGIYQENKSAFFGNINRLKQGAVLKIPNRDRAMLVDPARASRAVHMQDSAWQAYRHQLAQAAAAAPQVPVQKEEAAQGRIVTKPEAKTPPPAQAPRDVLTLSKGEPAGAAGTQANIQEKLQSMEEDLAAKGRSLKDAQNRVAQLEKTVGDLQRLLELQKQVGAKAPETPPPAAAPAQPPAPQPAVATPAPPPAATPAPVHKPSKPAPVAAPIPEPATGGGSSWLSTFIDNPLYIGGIVAAMLLSGLLWMMMVGSRRRQGLTNFEDSIMTGGEFKHEAVFNAGTATSGSATGSSALLTDFSRLGLGAIDTHEVDPIAEAEVYMAYGRDAQAEEILKEALGKDPSRHEITLKLLEIYAARKDPVAFETLASELYASLGGQPTETWLKAADLGRSVDPDNPLYRISPDLTPLKTAEEAAAEMRASQAAAAPEAEPEAEAQPALEEEEAIPEAGMGPTDLEEPVAFEAAPEVETQPETEPGVMEFEPSFAEPSAGGEAETLEWEVPPAPEEPAAEMGEEATATEELEWPEPSLESPAEEAVGAGGELEQGLPPAAEAMDSGLAEEAATLEEVSPQETAMEGLAEPELSEAVMPEALPETVAETAASMEAELELPEEPVVPETEPEEALPEGQEEETAAAPTLDFSGIDLELKEPSEAAEVKAEAPAGEAETAIDPELWEENNTKLDLARAYLEMGDKEGAREILQEVQADGDTKQREEADRLMAEAG